jgi:hypothetical protein
MFADDVVFGELKSFGGNFLDMYWEFLGLHVYSDGRVTVGMRPYDVKTGLPLPEETAATAECQLYQEGPDGGSEGSVYFYVYQ